MNLNPSIYYYGIAVDAPLWPDIWTYSFHCLLHVGDVVVIPFGKRNSHGVVIQQLPYPNEETYKIKAILEVHNQWKKIDEMELKLFLWTAKYYQYPIGKLIFDCLPAATKKIQKLEPVKIHFQPWPFKNSKDMESIRDRLSIIVNKGFSQHLIHGVTGSGKSLIYLQWIKEIVQTGKSVLYLVPEINLTPQFVHFFSSYLDVEIYQYHSQVSPGKKYALYHLLKTDHKPVLIISARSGIFLPVNNLGAIIIDEEHDQSYKQDDRCKYHARDVAIYRAKIQKIPILLGSATPSIESYFRFTHLENLKKYYYHLKQRYHNQTLPQVIKIKEPHYSDKSWPLSDEVIDEIRTTISAEGQVLVFVNKLGFSRYVQCKACHYDFSCPNCSVKLTYFKKRQMIECHLCEYKQVIPKSCPKCGCLEIWSQGFGVEKVVEKLSEYFNENTILRIDRDEAKTVAMAQERFVAFDSGKFNILVGTQMITKGHNFKNIKLVVVLGIDAQLHSPEFRAKERIFQLLNQVAGRAGRLGDSSKIYIQTNMLDEELDQIMDQEQEKFYEHEIMIRKLVFYPPWRKMAQLTLRGNDSNQVTKAIELIKSRLIKTIEENKLEMDIKGPRKASLEKVKNKFGETLILTTEHAELFSSLLKQLHHESKLLKKIQMIINIDPQHME